MPDMLTSTVGTDLAPASFLHNLELVGCEPRTDEHGILRARCPACRSKDPILLISQGDGTAICCAAGCDDLEVVRAVEALKKRAAKLPPTPPPPGRLFSEIPVSGTTSFLWKPRIPAGRITLIEGNGEKGKSVMLIDIVARGTTGRPMPLDEHACLDPFGAVWIGYEDGADTLRGRLAAAGADLSRILDLSTVPDDGGEAPFALPRHLPILEAGIRRVNAKIVVIDPITAALDGKTDSNNDTSVRRALTPLAALAESTGAAIPCIRHWGKSTDRNAAHRGGGSVAFTAAARAVWCFMTDPDDSEGLIMARVKANLANRPPGVRFKIESRDGHPVVTYTGLEPRTADEILDAKKTGAAGFLRELLKDGPMASSYVFTKGKAAGYSRDQIFKAKDEAGAKARKAGFGNAEWQWEIPSE